MLPTPSVSEFCKSTARQCCPPATPDAAPATFWLPCVARCPAPWSKPQSTRDRMAWWTGGIASPAMPTAILKFQARTLGWPLTQPLTPSSPIAWRKRQPSTSRSCRTAHLRCGWRSRTFTQRSLQTIYRDLGAQPCTSYSGPLDSCGQYLHSTFRRIFQRAPSHNGCDKSRILARPHQSSNLGMKPQTFHFVNDPDAPMGQTGCRHSWDGASESKEGSRFTDYAPLKTSNWPPCSNLRASKKGDLACGLGLSPSCSYSFF